jgi:hypothetical protein
MKRATRTWVVWSCVRSHHCSGTPLYATTISASAGGRYSHPSAPRNGVDDRGDAREAVKALIVANQFLETDWRNSGLRSCWAMRAGSCLRWRRRCRVIARIGMIEQGEIK